MTSFSRYWISETTNLLGSQFSILAVPAIAVLLLHATAVQTGILTAAILLPFPILAPFVGVFVDRRPRRNVLIVANLIQGAALVLIPVVAFEHFLTMGILYAVGLARGIASVFFDVADQSFIATLVQKDDLFAANSKLQFSASLASLLGQPLAGICVQVVGAIASIWIDSITYMLSSMLLWSIPEDHAPATRRDSTTLASSLGEALRAILEVKALPYVIACNAIINFGAALTVPIYFIFLFRVLQLTPALAGVIAGISAAGMLLASLVANRAKNLSLWALLCSTASIEGLCYMAMPLATHVKWAGALVCTLTFASSVQIVLFHVAVVSFRQSGVDESLQGRVNAFSRALSWGVIPVGNLAGGFIGNAFGVAPVYLLSGIIVALSSILVIYAKLRGCFDRTN